MPARSPSDRRAHALARSIRSLAIGVVRDMNVRSAGVALEGAAEREEQFQIAVSGSATDYPAWATVLLPFDTVWSTATGQRMSTLQRPQTYFGYELTSVTRAGAAADQGVILSAVIRQWRFDEYQTIDGAYISIAAFAPGDQLAFSGFVHATFQGFGTPGQSKDDDQG